MKAVILLLVLFVSACGGRSDHAENDENLVISVLNSGGGAVVLNSVSYALVDTPDTEYELECEEGCSVWEFPEDLVGSVNISASVQLENVSDPLCLDFYSGEKYVDVNPAIEQRINLILYYEATACE